MKRNYWLSRSIIDELMSVDRQGLTMEPLARIFNAHGRESWELAWIESCGDIAYGWCDMGDREFGPFSIAELQKLPYKFGCALEIDQSFNGSYSKV